ncbi:hypothetical protein BKA16_001192 [Gordonia humi]|uniref:Uncharacterized protein n=1 Tax=Gordonia humi TaxID=686429 RepID=A0A840F2X8_9ACTN|nr:hypothetical protein [Gordonia humi]
MNDPTHRLICNHNGVEIREAPDDVWKVVLPTRRYLWMPRQYAFDVATALADAIDNARGN